ncbi:hypothetical protein Tco_0674234 [Tanacetum coccineum]
MARESALRAIRVVHADVRQATPAWTNTNRVNKANQFTPRPVQLSNIRPNLSTASKTIKTGRVNVNTGHGNVNSGSVHVNSGTQFKSGASRFNTGKQHVNSGSVHVNSGTQFKSGASRFNTGKQHVNSSSVHVNTGRVNRPVINNTSPKPSQVNLKSPKKCFSKQRSPVNRPFSRNTAHKSNKYAVKGKIDTAVKTSAGCVWRKVIPLSNTNSENPLITNDNVSRGPQGRPKPMKAWVTRINWRILKNSIGDLLPLEFTMSNQYKDWLVQEQMALGKDYQIRSMSSGDKDSLGDDASKQGRIDIGDINTDAEITLIDETQGRKCLEASPGVKTLSNEDIDDYTDEYNFRGGLLLGKHTSADMPEDKVGDNGVVESDGAVKCDEVILVSDGSEASNSSLVRRETGVGSDEVGVQSNDGGDVLAASG